MLDDDQVMVLAEIMPFLDGDVVVRQIGVERFELVEPICYECGEKTFVVPAGFDTDFASVPRAFLWLLPRYGVYTRAAILHDCLVSKDSPVSRVEADRIFRQALRDLNTPFMLRWIMWAAVRFANPFASPPGEFLIWLVVTVLTAAFLAIPTIVICIWITIFWIFELVHFWTLKIFSRKPVDERPELDFTAQ